MNPPLMTPEAIIQQVAWLRVQPFTDGGVGVRPEIPLKSELGMTPLQIWRLIGTHDLTWVEESKILFSHYILFLFFLSHNCMIFMKSLVLRLLKDSNTWNVAYQFCENVGSMKAGISSSGGVWITTKREKVSLAKRNHGAVSQQLCLIPVSSVKLSCERTSIFNFLILHHF